MTNRVLEWCHLRTKTYPIEENFRRSGTWADVVESLSHPVPTENKGSTGAWVPASFISLQAALATKDAERLKEFGGKQYVRRTKLNVKEVHCLVVDIDVKGEGEDKQRAEARAEEERAKVTAKLKQSGVAYVLHSTFSNLHAFRLVVPLSAPVPGESWWDFWHWGLHVLGIAHSADASCKDPSRLYYLPEINSKERTESVVEVFEGRAFDITHIQKLGAWPDRPHEKTKKTDSFGPAGDGVKWAALQSALRVKAIDGEHGDAKTFAVAALLTHDWALTKEEAWPLLQAWNATNALPPWEESELRLKFENGFDYAQGVFGGKRTEKPETDWEREWVVAEIRRRTSGNSAAVKLPPPKSFSALMGETFPASQWVIKKMLPLNCNAILAGDPKASKTWTLLEMALAVSSGTSMWGTYEAEKGAAVLFLTEDSWHSVQNRVRALCAQRGLDAAKALAGVSGWSRQNLELTDDYRLADLILAVRALPQRPLFIGLDPFRNVHGAEENSSTEIKPVLQRVSVIRELCGCAVVMVHHTNKKTADDVRSGAARMRGSSAIDAWRDTLIALEDTEKSEEGDSISNTCTVEHKAFRGAGTFKVQLQMRDNPETHTADTAEWVLSDVEKKKKPEASVVEVRDKPDVKVAFNLATLRWFRRRQQLYAERDLPTRPVSRNAVFSEVRADVPCAKQTAMEVFRLMVNQGKLVEVPNPGGFTFIDLNPEGETSNEN